MQRRRWGLLHPLRAGGLFLAFFILPLLTGCITSSALHTAKTPVNRILPDKVSRVEKAGISDDKNLVIYLEGFLSNSPHRSQFVVNIPLEEIKTNAEIRRFEMANDLNIYNYGVVNVARNAIHAGWMPPENSGHKFQAVALGIPIPPPSVAGANYQWEWAYAENAKLLPNTTRTLYLLTERLDSKRDDFSAPLEFIYVDSSSNQKYTIIRVEKSTIPDNSHKAAYCLVPLTVPLDIATAPFQLAGELVEAWLISGLGSTP